MWRRIKQIVLPGIIILALALAGTLLAGWQMDSQYRAQSNQETAQLIGLVLREHPDADATEILQALRGELDPEL